MSILRLLIIVGQLGRIWSSSRMYSKVFQTMTAVGYFSLLTNIPKRLDNEERKQVFRIGEQEANVRSKYLHRNRSRR